MREPIENEYFNWLCAKVMTINSPTYLDLMRILYATEFIWMISGDDNREEDGLELRLDFLTETKVEFDPGWFSSPCSILEVLIAFANRASFQTDDSVKYWFWQFINNLGLDEYRRVDENKVQIIEDILDMFVWRTYDSNGFGGLFPLRWPKQDQRKVEIWYQFCEYLYDQGRF